MPLYEYRCQACQRRFEVLQRLGEDARGLACPACGGVKLEKLFSTFAAAVGGGSSSSSSEAACDRPGCGSGFT